MEIMTPEVIVIFVALLRFAKAGILQIIPSDIYLTKNATLEAQCKIDKLAGIQSRDVKFRFMIDKQFGPESHKQNNSGHFKYEVPNMYIKVHNDSLVSITHNVYSPKFTNSVLECYVNESIYTKSMVLLGDFPHNVTGASCLVKNWKNMSCEITTSGKHEIFTTNWNYCLSDDIRSAEINKTLQSGNSFVQENIFDHFKINDTLVMEVFASNHLGFGYKSHFEFPLMNLVVPDPGYLYFNNISNNYVMSLSLVLPKPDEEFFISIEVNCSNMPSTYKFDSNTSESDGRILINLSEEHLPASQNCSAFSRLKPLHYGRFSDKSNIVMFRTRDRVPLKNPDIFNSSLEVRQCNRTMCDIDVYFKPLNVEEAQGHVIQYRVKLGRNGKVNRETLHANNGMPFISIESLSRDHMREFLVSIEAATEAGYNNTINTQLMRLNASVDNYKHFPSEFLNKSEVSSKPLLLAMHLVVLNDSHVDIVYHLDDDSDNIFIVWCLYDKSNQRCKNNFSWKQLIKTKGVMEFDVPSGDKISEYNFGLQIGSGLQWIKFPCFFIATPESKPGVPVFHDIISNMSHIVLNVSLPKCSETEAINFPGGYLVEWFDLRKNDNIINRTYHYLDNPIVIDGLHPGIYNVSVHALPWKQGACSEKFYFQHVSVDEGSVDIITYICVTVALLVVGICIACLLKMLRTQKLLKIDVPKNQYEIHETVRGYSNFTSKVSTSGYTVCISRDVEEIKISSSDGNLNKTSGECHLNLVDSSSGHSYAVTKLVDHSICLKEKLLDTPAKPIQLDSHEGFQEIIGGQAEEKFQHDEIMGSEKVGSDSSCESSFPEYPSTMTLIPADAALDKQENILGKITSTTSTNCPKCTETDQFGNVKDDYLVTRAVDSGASSDSGANSDGYCERSVFKNVPMFI